ncbi:nuclear pore complex protein Nup153 isoform X2 [Manduca sexta]|uniref:nuclear pore complex protein Nup153 isoform X2 n=1 Tax=Manduca sexta TaxID=7130 RepID=UPI00188F0F4F|nr:nuclear pore complex protein Nup153 isoform X2 [Manduca sexta]
MNTVFSRNKEKRPRSSTSESNNSFVKNVTSRVSGLLPATITKWFSSPSSSNANGSAPAADITDSSTEDEATESPVSSQPPAKRMRYSTPGKLNRFGSTDGNSIPRSVESKETPNLPYNTVQSPPGRNTFRRETNFVSTPIRVNEESVVEKSDKDAPLFKTQHTISVIGPTVATKRKSLFEALSTSDSLKAKPSLNTSRDSNQPSFKPALLGSPFYHGRTMYGGAASSYINQPNIKQRKVAYVNESNTSDTATMSHSTRRIMDLLENYSSPLTEAKRIPKYVRTPRNESVTVNPENSQNNTNNSYKMQELHIPGIASILRMKQKSRLMDTTSAARQLIASYSSATEYNPYPSSPNNIRKENTSKDTNSNLTTKVKARVTRQLRGDNVNESPPPPVQLPNVVLQIDNLPKFTLDKPLTPAFTVADSSTVTTTTPSKMTATTTVISSVFSIPYYITMSPTSTISSKPGITCNNRPFIFSLPVKVSSETAENCETPPRFSFGYPDHSIDRPNVDDKKLDSSVVVGSVKETAKSVDNPKDWKCSECCISNKPNTDTCVCCGNKKEKSPVEKQEKCVICKLANSQPHVNKCVNCDKAQSKVSDYKPMKPASTSQWKCSECWVGNDNQAIKCVCCGANKIDTSANTVATKSETSDDIWKCFICWITNKNNEDNCTCCGTSRNFASFSKSPKCSVCKLADRQPNNNKCVNCEKIQPNMTGKSGPSDKSQWKCQECWVSNEESAEKCVCCGANNPKKVATDATKEKSTPPISFNNNSNGDWKCDECWITNKGSTDKCDACGGPKPGTKPSSSAQGFRLIAPSPLKPSDDVFKNIAKSQKGSKWECSSCLVKNDDDKTICVCCGADREYKMQGVGIKSFNFGQNTTNTFKFGINANFQNTNATKMEHTTIAEDVVVVECETNNNVLDKTPTFTFTLPAKKSDDSTKVTKENKIEAPKINFNFGIPKQTNELAATNKPSEPNKALEDKKVVQEVSKVEPISSVPTPAATAAKPLPTLFTPPTSSTATPSPVVLALLGSDKDVLSSPNTTQAVAATAQVTQAENKFGFSVGGLKPSMNIFNAPASTTSSAVAASTPSLFTSPVRTTASATTTMPTMSLFQKPESSTTSTVTMFSNKDPVTTTTISLFQKSETVASNAGTASFFSFGTNTQTTTQPAAEKPKFSFTFGGNKTETPTVFKPSFGSLSDSSSGTNKFALPAPNLLSGGNGLSGSPMGGPNGLSTGNALTGNVPSPGNMIGATNELSANPLSGASGLQSTSAMSRNIFGAPVVKENMWPSNNNNNNNNNSASTNIFVSNTGGPSMLQKPATFTFGSSSPFNTNNSTPTFGANPQPVQNIFGISNQNNAPQPSLFATPTPSQAAPTVFGSPAQPSNPAPAMGIFGTPNAAATPTFGVLNQQIPSFETPSLTPTPGTAFNFGSPQPSAVFGFGQQQQQQQPQQPQQSGVYNFGATGAAPQVQFNMGSSPNPAQRRVRKAVRRNPPR